MEISRNGLTYSQVETGYLWSIVRSIEELTVPGLMFDDYEKYKNIADILRYIIIADVRDGK